MSKHDVISLEVRARSNTDGYWNVIQEFPTESHLKSTSYKLLGLFPRVREWLEYGEPRYKEAAECAKSLRSYTYQDVVIKAICSDGGYRYKFDVWKNGKWL